MIPDNHITSVLTLTSSLWPFVSPLLKQVRVHKNIIWKFSLRFVMAI